jgi:hypothetical protein
MRLDYDSQPGVILGGRLLSANMNVTTDQAIPIVSPSRYYRIFQLVAINPSTSLTTAQGSLYLGAGKSVIINATTSAYSAATNATIDTLNNMAVVSIQNNVLTDNTTIYLSLTTAQGAAATCDIYVYIMPLYGA